MAALREKGILPFLASGNDGWNNFTGPPSSNTDAIAVGALQFGGETSINTGFLSVGVDW